MHLLLKELGFPEAPIPTRAAIDLMDTVRRNTLGLLSLQTAIKAKQRKVEALRQQLGDLIPNPTRRADVFIPHIFEC